ncbi:MAG TPA: MBL fold metallo-hydrolase [Steroidobacteraceae bacterium]|jgi:ribonuclease BN (tRNA processing enzyme)|nr:MBL fold metallo-hydrolase [Steroidobacteraceae bacterium]
MTKSNPSLIVAATVLLLFCLSSRLLAEAPVPPLELLVLGSGGPGAAGRAASSYLVYVDGTARILVDAGPGSFARLGEARASLSSTDLVLLTHLHIDHVAELPGLFKARAVSSSGAIVFNVWGPKGSPGHGQDAYFPSTREFMQLLFGPKGAFAYLSDFAAPVSIRAHDLAASAGNAIPEQIFKEGDLSIRAVAGHHGDAPAVIYRIDHGGKSVTFSGDIDAGGLQALRGIAKNTDLLVFNSVVLDPPDSPAVLYTLHTPPLAIGQLAKAAGARGLLLSHLSPAVDEKRDAVLKSIRRNFPGSVTFAGDGLRARP